jgi:tRNA pseudouridine13 synthase
MEIYSTETEGFDGKIKRELDDFIVEEVLQEYGKAYPLSKTWGEGGNHLLCVVVRRGWETFHLIDQLAKILKIPKRSIGFAGLKDKRASVKQFLSFEGADLNRICNIQFKGIHIYPRDFLNERLSSKSLLGNRFTITIRNIECTSEEVSSVVNELTKLGGFLNFYGYQRFGSIRPVTHLVGRLLVKRKFEDAIRTYLGYIGIRESGDSQVARKAFGEESDLKKIYKLFPPRLIYERKILKRLMKIPDDYLGAFKALPLGLRRLFVNAFQSYLFNRLLSVRVREGLPLNKVLRGDWVVGFKPNGVDYAERVKTDESNLKKLNRLISEGKACLALPIFGYLSELSGGTEGILEKRIINEEDIVSLKNFYIGALPEASSMGGLRPALSYFKGFKWSRSQRNLKTEFFLFKECYASTLLREFLKPSDPVSFGF